MLPIRMKYHAVFNKNSSLKIAFFVIFALLVNILNLPAVMTGKYLISENRHNTKTCVGTGKICGAIAMPVHIMNDLLGKVSLAMCGVEKTGAGISGNAAAVFEHNGQRTAILRGERLIVLSINACSHAGIALPVQGMGAPGGYEESGDLYKKALLLLILISVLPRGISALYDNNENIRF